jgi:hypothetical protein
MRDDSNRRRLLGHADPSRLDERPARRDGVRGRRRGDDRPERRGRARHPVCPPRRPAFGGPERVRRPSAVPPAPTGTGRCIEPGTAAGAVGNAAFGDRSSAGDRCADGQPAGGVRNVGCHAVAVNLCSAGHGPDSGLTARCERRFSRVVLGRRSLAGRPLDSNAPLGPASGREDPHSGRGGHPDCDVDAEEADRRARGAHDSILRRTPHDPAERPRLSLSVQHHGRSHKRNSLAPRRRGLAGAGGPAHGRRRCRNRGCEAASRPLWFARPRAYHWLKCRATT